MFTLNYRVHLSIYTLPIKNWQAVSEQSSLQPLIKRGIAPKNILDIWYDLQDQYTNRYGVTKEYEEYINLVKRATLLKCEFVEKGTRYLLNDINMMDEDIKTKQLNTHPLKLKDILPKMSKHYGFKVSESISVVEFFDLLNGMNNG